ncbi:hypothetical protein ACN38_g5309, partial [Penicillium nordicum]
WERGNFINIDSRLGTFPSQHEPYVGKITREPTLI